MSSSSVSGGFAASGDPRGRLRGTLPRAAVGHLKALLESRQRVVEIGCGTGVLTGALQRALRGTVPLLLAVDPQPDRLAQLRRSLPGIPALLAQDGHLPLRTASCDALVVNLLDPQRTRSDDSAWQALHSELTRVAIAGRTILVVVAPAGSTARELQPYPAAASRAVPPEARRFTGGEFEVAVEVALWQW